MHTHVHKGGKPGGLSPQTMNKDRLKRSAAGSQGRPKVSSDEKGARPCALAFPAMLPTSGSTLWSHSLYN